MDHRVAAAIAQYSLDFGAAPPRDGARVVLANRRRARARSRGPSGPQTLHGVAALEAAFDTFDTRRQKTLAVRKRPRRTVVDD